MSNEQELINKICDLSKKLGHTEGLLQRKTEMLDKCDKRVREIREDKNRVCKLIKGKLEELNNKDIDDTGLLTEEYWQIVSHNDGIVKGLNFSLDLLLEGINGNKD